MTVKTTLKLTFLPTQDCRRLVVDPRPHYSELLDRISALFEVDARKDVSIQYIDSDNDYIHISCEDDLTAAYIFAEEVGNPPILRLLVSVKASMDSETALQAKSCTCKGKDAAMPDGTADDLRKHVSERYAELATTELKPCSCKSKKYAMSLGYTSDDLAEEDTPVAALSCGNPVGIADLKEGETVMDLGCGTGFDCRLAAKRVGPSGKVVGIDMTQEMLDKARQLTKADKYPQVTFRRSTIEDVGSITEFAGQFDAVLSNCVFNLSPEKPRVLSSVFAVLKPGGRLIFSDPVALRPIPAAVRADMASYTQCMSNASSVESLSSLLAAAGFERVAVEVKSDSTSYVARWTPGSLWDGGRAPASYIATATIWAYKPTA